MSDLLLVTLGPVQDFIAQARRTRDLWFGSHLLSELSRAAAKTIVEGGGELIFPAIDPTRAEERLELDYCPELIRERTKRAPLNVVNRILARVVDGRMAAEAARAGAQALWRGVIAKPALHKNRLLLAAGCEAIVDEQIATFLEVAAVWAPLPGPSHYARVRDQLDRALQGRRLLRDFSVWQHGRSGAPKSSLDGARVSVLAPAKKRDSQLVRRLRLDETEQLDAVGLVKRGGLEPEQFVPVPNIALAAWIASAKQVAAEPMRRLQLVCDRLGFKRVVRPDLRWTQDFPLDAEVFLRSRWRALLEEAGHGGDYPDPRAWGGHHVGPILGAMPEPFPYVACLVADGDRMGRALDGLTDEAQHRDFSRNLSRFADRARTILERNHRGALVYSGGDDVLGFVCVQDALACADELRRAFSEIMDRALAGTAVARPTLSVGLGVGHLLEGLGDLLDLGRQAEQAAKSDPRRNRLAVIIDPRSGGRLAWQASWDDDPAARLSADLALLDEPLSNRKVYEIDRDLRAMPDPAGLTQSDQAKWAQILVDDLTRTLGRAEADSPTPLRPADVGLSFSPNPDFAKRHAAAKDWVQRLLVARIFLKAKRSAEPGGS